MFSAFKDVIDKTWTVHCEHMTICIGTLQNPQTEDLRSVASEFRNQIAKYHVGQRVDLRVVSKGISSERGVCAVGVLGCASCNRNPHITVACAPNCRPKLSNYIQHWEMLDTDKQFVVHGEIQQR
eukprot:gnl/MRDRNA2_/MRDRNA2_304541_c0_seq1.p2 gnl/MRDRNA2_/MRDRNA2_304541_c0~~gnl/MRDRNA2_/MRDRNA2_304541_c0_seq1.p2  ORF type:complete len:125 (+),score=16.83 gnl/MRDRNA2_/MRDRNA2_304541_c0_seq1:27-401(+)